MTSQETPGELNELVNLAVELQRIQALLSVKLQYLQVLVKVRSKQPSPDGGLCEEAIKHEAEELREKLQKRVVFNTNKQEVIKLLRYGQEAFESTHKKLFSVSKDETYELPIKIVQKLEEVRELNKKLSDKVSIIDSVEAGIETSKKKLQQLEWKNRELSALLDRSERKANTKAYIAKIRETNSENKEPIWKLESISLNPTNCIIKEHTKIDEASDGLDKSVKELTLRRETFRALIQASKMDWFSDPQLLERVLSLGQPLNFTFNC